MAPRKRAPRSRAIFTGCVIAVGGDLGKSDWPDDKISKWITMRDGSFTSNAKDREVTHILATEKLYREVGSGVRKLAAKGNVHVVTWEWLEDSINQNKKLKEDKFSLSNLARAEAAKKRTSEKAQKGIEEGKKGVNSNLNHIYTDSEFFQYNVNLLRTDTDTGKVREKWQLCLWESNANPPLYLCTAKFNKSRSAAMIMRPSGFETPGSFEREYEAFKKFFEIKTGLYWDERIQKAGTEPPPRFQYTPPTRGKPVGVVNDRLLAKRPDCRNNHIETDVANDKANNSTAGASGKRKMDEMDSVSSSEVNEGPETKKRKTTTVTSVEDTSVTEPENEAAVRCAFSVGAHTSSSGVNDDRMVIDSEVNRLQARIEDRLGSNHPKDTNEKDINISGDQPQQQATDGQGSATSRDAVGQPDTEVVMEFSSAPLTQIVSSLNPVTEGTSESLISKQNQEEEAAGAVLSNEAQSESRTSPQAFQSNDMVDTVSSLGDERIEEENLADDNRVEDIVMSDSDSEAPSSMHDGEFKSDPGEMGLVESQYARHNEMQIDSRAGDDPSLTTTQSGWTEIETPQSEASQEYVQQNSNGQDNNLDHNGDDSPVAMEDVLISNNTC